MSIQILNADCRVALKSLPAESVHCCVTSPPYLGLRDYGTAQWQGGDSGCEHQPRVASRDTRPSGGLTAGKSTVDAGTVLRQTCHCGAIRVDSQIGLEASPAEYIEQLVVIFREVRRVLHPTATLWVVIGDSYAGSWGNQGRKEGRGTQRPVNGPMLQNLEPYPDKQSNTGRIPEGSGLKRKDLMMIPARVALALQDDGWWLRSDIIWAKRNCMPSSATDRPTNSHEHVFLLAKREHYFYDATAIREPHKGYRKAGPHALRGQVEIRPRGNLQSVTEQSYHADGRNKRDVWEIATQPLIAEKFGAETEHFAAFPEALVTPCVQAGTSEKGCCAQCLAPWKRITESVTTEPVDYEGKWAGEEPQASGRRMLGNVRARREMGFDHDNPFPGPRTLGWEPTCRCDAGPPRPCTVLDIFGGSGTVGKVCQDLGRDAILIELNPEYCELARKRVNAARLPLLDEEAAV